MKRERYVHGWGGYIQCVYGKSSEGKLEYVQPCTYAEAEKMRRNQNSSRRPTYRIYKLVDVTPSETREAGV